MSSLKKEFVAICEVCEPPELNSQPTYILLGGSHSMTEDSGQSRAWNFTQHLPLLMGNLCSRIAYWVILPFQKEITSPFPFKNDHRN